MPIAKPSANVATGDCTRGFEERRNSHVGLEEGGVSELAQPRGLFGQDDGLSVKLLWRRVRPVARRCEAGRIATEAKVVIGWASTAVLSTGNRVSPRSACRPATHFSISIRNRCSTVTRVSLALLTNISSKCLPCWCCMCGLMTDFRTVLNLIGGSHAEAKHTQPSVSWTGWRSVAAH